jgi:3-phosphoshikimate 1-carboxyvinyltransferase
MGVVGGCPITVTFDGDASLRKRPMRRVLDPLERMGARALSESPGGRLPLTLSGATDPLPIVYEPPAASAQLKSAVLLAGLAAPGETSVLEAEATRDHTERMLRHFGADVRVEPLGAHGRRVTLVGQPELVPATVAVPADPSSAAFPLVAALIVPRSDIVIESLMTNPLRTGLITTLAEMGASIVLENRRQDGGEEVADVRVRASSLAGVDVPPERAPSMIDEYPVLAVAATFAEGITHLEGIGELRFKESDRVATVMAGLKANGIKAEDTPETLTVHGAATVEGGGMVATHLDHRIAMSFLVLGLASEKPVIVDDARPIATSYPEFRNLMAGLGAHLADADGATIA